MNRNEEIMTILQEECAEVIQAVSKVRRFGHFSTTGMEDLKKELCDLQCMINLMEEFNVISYHPGDRYDQIMAKRKKLEKYSKIFGDLMDNPEVEMSEHTKNSIDWFGSPNGA